ncbi:hypothetical protein IMY05_015G0012100 [Salix suchowensis]|nr:hypothetical protein IMY05_015G0012100 [Salix suchowensis]
MQKNQFSPFILPLIFFISPSISAFQRYIGAIGEGFDNFIGNESSDRSNLSKPLA